MYGRSVSWSVGRSVGRLVDQSVGRSVGRSVGQMKDKEKGFPNLVSYSLYVDLAASNSPPKWRYHNWCLTLLRNSVSCYDDDVDISLWIGEEPPPLYALWGHPTCPRPYLDYSSWFSNIPLSFQWNFRLSIHIWELFIFEGKYGGGWVVGEVGEVEIVDTIFLSIFAPVGPL